MSLVRVHWTESVSYSADLEIDGFDPAAEDVDEVLDDAICQLEGKEWEDAFDSVDERSVTSTKVVREGELAVAVVRDAPAHEPDWED